MPAIGEVKSIKSEHEIEWKIHNFSSLSDENSVCYSSPTFLFCKESWYLQICPNGWRIPSKDYISLFLRPKSCGSPIKIEYTLGLKKLSGQKVSEKYCEGNFTKPGDGYGYNKFILRSEIFDRNADLLPNDVIAVFFCLKFPTSNETPIKEASNEKCSLCEKIVDADNLVIHQKKDKPIKCVHCSAVFTLQSWCDHECQAQKSSCEPVSELSDGSLSEDFKKMLQDGINHDLILKVGNKEIRAHKDVLRSRCQVFKSMLEHDMKEKNSGIVDVSDCDSEAMEVFLSYVYSGKFDILDQNNMLNLYYIADKYQMSLLKHKCCSFIEQSISPTNFCDVIQLALNHSDSDLITFATEYFCNNVLDVLQTVEWQSFLKDNSTVANELFIKSHKNKK